MKNGIEIVKRSVLAKWREQIVKDNLDNEYLDKMTDKEREIYSHGIRSGFRECISTLSLHKIIKLIID